MVSAAMAGRRGWPVRVRRVSPGPTGRRTRVMGVWVALVVPAVPVGTAVLAVWGAVAEAALGLVAS